MSSRANIDLPEFFHDTKVIKSTRGHRLVDSIKKRERGNVRKQNFIFMDCETDRLDPDVQLEKLHTPKQKNVEMSSPLSIKMKCAPTGRQKMEMDENRNEKSGSDLCDTVNFEFSKPYNLLPATTSAIQNHNPINISPIQSVIASKPSMRKSGGVSSPSDKLRRISVKNSSAKKLCDGRRTSLKEFESTVEGHDFNPAVCSTPIVLSALSLNCKLTCEIQKNTPLKTNADVYADGTTQDEIQNTLLPPPSGFESDSTVDKNSTTIQYTNNVTLQIRPPHDNIEANLSNNNDDHLCGSLRRSKRGQVPRREFPILNILRQQEVKLMEKYERVKKLREEAIKIDMLNKGKKLKTTTTSKGLRKRKDISPATAKENRDTQTADCNSQDTVLVKRVKSTGTKRKKNHRATRSKRKKPNTEDHLNIFDELKTNNPTTPLAASVCPLRSAETTPSLASANVSNASSFSNSNTGLVSWLESLGATHCNAEKEPEPESVTTRSATDLCFTELNGVEYAFYDTEESLGYLRFKPHQVKGKKKNEYRRLQFVNCKGLFRIAVNSSGYFLDVGDLVTVKTLDYYEIQNMSDNIGILMVLKD